MANAAPMPSKNSSTVGSEYKWKGYDYKRDIITFTNLS